MSTNVQAHTGDIKKAIRHAMDLLGSGEHRLAREQAEEILRVHPNEVNSQFVVAAAMRARGQTAQALSSLEGLTQRVPDFALALQELGFTYADKSCSLLMVMRRPPPKLLTAIWWRFQKMPTRQWNPG